MVYYNSLKDIRLNKKTIITAGKFDGVHRGHQLLLSRAAHLAEETGSVLCVFTFQTSPQARISHKKSSGILDNSERKELFDRMGVDVLVECPFTDAIRTMEPEEFIAKILIGRLNGRGIVVGTDFYFGKDRKGTPELLAREGEKNGLIVEVLDKLMDGDREISSTYVREELKAGRIEKVNELLGFPYYARGVVVHGQKNGHLLGFPTANIIPDEHKLLPPFGVYSTRIQIDGVTYESITNIGKRPTFQGDYVTIETNIPGFKGDLYGKEACVEFRRFVRPERPFSSIGELKSQIRSDVAGLGFAVDGKLAQ